jgi:hypothetical protein
VKSLIEKGRAELLAAADSNDEEAIDTINYNIVKKKSTVKLNVVLTWYYRMNA